MSDDFTTREINVPRSNLWPYRLWREQAQRLSPGNPQRQQRAIAEYISITRHYTSSPTRWVCLAAIGASLVETREVQPCSR